MKHLLFLCFLSLSTLGLAQSKKQRIKQQQEQITLLQHQLDSVNQQAAKFQAENTMLRKKLATSTDSLNHLSRRLKVQQYQLEKAQDKSLKHETEATPVKTKGHQALKVFVQTDQKGRKLIKQVDLSQLQVHEETTIYLTATVDPSGKVLKADNQADKSSSKDLKLIQQVIEKLIKEARFAAKPVKVNTTENLIITFHRE